MSSGFQSIVAREAGVRSLHTESAPGSRHLRLASTVDMTEAQPQQPTFATATKEVLQPPKAYAYTPAEDSSDPNTLPLGLHSVSLRGDWLLGVLLRRKWGLAWVSSGHCGGEVGGKG